MIRSASLPNFNDPNMPAAGGFRQPLHVHRELMARAGSHIASWQAQSPSMPRLLPEKMDLSRGVPDGDMRRLVDGDERYEPRPAGVPMTFQTAKARSEFKEQAVFGQFSNELLAAISPSKKLYHSVRCLNQTYVTHNKRMPGLRLERERRMGQDH